MRSTEYETFLNDSLRLILALVMLIPLRLLWGLRVNQRQKLALLVIFSLVFIIIVFAIVRVVEISPSSQRVDPVWLVLWSMTEGSVGRFF